MCGLWIPDILVVLLRHDYSNLQFCVILKFEVTMLVR